MSNTAGDGYAFAPQQEAREAQAQANAARTQAQAQANAARTQAQAQVNAARAEAQAQANQATAQARETQREVQEQIRAAMQAAKEVNAELQAQAAGARQGPYTSGTGRPYGDGAIPPQVVDILGILGITLVCCVVGLPLARSIARWIDRRGTAPTVPREVASRLESIEQAVESVAVEVERISEGQRFTTRMLSERTHEPTPGFAPERELVPVSAPAGMQPNTPANIRRS